MIQHISKEGILLKTLVAQSELLCCYRLCGNMLLYRCSASSGSLLCRTFTCLHTCVCLKEDRELVSVLRPSSVLAVLFESVLHGPPPLTMLNIELTPSLGCRMDVCAFKRPPYVTGHGGALGLSFSSSCTSDLYNTSCVWSDLDNHGSDRMSDECAGLLLCSCRLTDHQAAVCFLQWEEDEGGVHSGLLSVSMAHI